MSENPKRDYVQNLVVSSLLRYLKDQYGFEKAQGILKDQKTGREEKFNV